RSRMAAIILRISVCLTNRFPNFDADLKSAPMGSKSCTSSWLFASSKPTNLVVVNTVGKDSEGSPDRSTGNILLILPSSLKISISRETQREEGVLGEQITTRNCDSTNAASI